MRQINTTKLDTITKHKKSKLKTENLTITHNTSSITSQQKNSPETRRIFQ